MVLLQRKLYFSKDPEGVQHFRGGGDVQLFPVGGGPNANFYRKPISLVIFQEGIRTPYPPLDPHTVLVHPRKMVLYIQGTRLLSTVLVQPRIRLLN